jgi:type IV pilus assembly protein PilX
MKNGFGGKRSFRQRERGAILLVGLVMLIMITLISLVAMQNTRQQTRMAGNTNQYTTYFQRAESGLRSMENIIYLRRHEEDPVGTPGWVRVNEDFENPGSYVVPDLDSPGGWTERGSVDLTEIYGANAEGFPWFVVEQLPNTVSNKSLQAENKRDMEVFRVNVLYSDADPTVTNSASTIIVILQSVVFRH